MKNTIKMCVFIFVIACLQIAVAQVPFPRHCPVVKVMDTFDVDAYMGIWYEHSKYPFIFEVGKKCMYAQYENLGNDTIGVTNAAVNRFTGSSSNITGQARVVGPAQLAVVFSNRQKGDKANYLVLGTDYNSYALVYSCSNLTSFAHTKIVWILTRERKPSVETVNAARKVMDDNQLSQSYLMNTIQDNCTNDPPNLSVTVNLPNTPNVVNTNVEGDDAADEGELPINLRNGPAFTLDRNEAEDLDMLNHI